MAISSITETDMDMETDAEDTAIALQRDIQVKRAELIEDIDRLRDAVRERVSVRHFLNTHPRVTQMLTIGLGVAGIGTFVFLWRATANAGRRDDSY